MLKVLLFLLMVVLAAFATTMLHRRMVRLGAAERAEPPGENANPIDPAGRSSDLNLATRRALLPCRAPPASHPLAVPIDGDLAS